MGHAISTVGALIANPSSTYTAAAASTGDSLQFPSFALTSRAMLLHILRGGTTAGDVRVRSPRLHDNVQGIRFSTDKARTVYQMPEDIGQPIYPGDTPIVELTGGTNETEVAVLTAYYQDLPGANARLATYADIAPNIVNIKPVQISVTAGTVGQWGNAALNATEDLLEANTDYAVLGVQTSQAILAVALAGPDTSNLKIGAPGDDSTLRTDDYFVTMSRKLGLPLIPVINSNNKGATNVYAIDHTTTSATKVQLILGQLGQPFTG